MKKEPFFLIYSDLFKGNNNALIPHFAEIMPHFFSKGEEITQFLMLSFIYLVFKVLKLS